MKILQSILIRLIYAKDLWIFSGIPRIPANSELYRKDFGRRKTCSKSHPAIKLPMLVSGWEFFTGKVSLGKWKERRKEKTTVTKGGKRVEELVGKSCVWCLRRTPKWLFFAWDSSGTYLCPSQNHPRSRECCLKMTFWALESTPKPPPHKPNPKPWLSRQAIMLRSVWKMWGWIFAGRVVVCGGKKNYKQSYYLECAINI